MTRKGTNSESKKQAGNCYEFIMKTFRNVPRIAVSLQEGSTRDGTDPQPENHDRHVPIEEQIGKIAARSGRRRYFINLSMSTSCDPMVDSSTSLVTPTFFFFHRSRRT